MKTHFADDKTLAYIAELERELQSLRAEAAKLPECDARDAARYRWLRDRMAVEDVERLPAHPEYVWEGESLKTDAAIDAAIASGAGES